MIADWVWYICPVPAARPIVAKRLDDPTVARSPLVFPGPELIGDAVEGGSLLGSRVRNYYVYADADEYAEWASVFEPVVYST
jgi:spermidine/putrescine transport system substrate-binding protein